MAPDDFTILLPTPVRQVYVHGLLQAARKSVLHDVLLQTLGNVDPDALADELKELSPAGGRRALAAVGIRDELVFAAPSVLRVQPSLVGYYRLLLGVSQKQFYTARSGLSRFKNMEVKNTLPAAVAPLLAELCRGLNDAMGELVTAVAGGFTAADVNQLPLLALGAQFDGSWRTKVGDIATKDVFETIRDIVKSVGIEFAETDTSLALVNRSGRKITVALAADPDVVITEELAEGRSMLKVAIEIKGGKDRSNAHNRAGEAEKSHQKARNKGAGDFWTVIATEGVDREVLKQESPTTRQWFDLDEILERRDEGWQRLQDQVLIAMGI